MTQSNEHVFFDEAGIYISQYRFMTSDGITYPTRNLLQVFPSETRPMGCLGELIFYGGLLLGIVAFFTFFFSALRIAVWHGAGEVIIGNFYNAGPTWTAAVLSMITIVLTAIGCTLALRLRRRSYVANFFFAGGEGIRRLPDYRASSYDKQWTERLIAAANEAMIAAQQT